MLGRNIICITLVILFILGTGAAHGQTTEFTYQGKLNDAGIAANGTYDLRFQLYDAAAGGNLLGTQDVPSVTVASGIFSVNLSFGSALFNGTDRFLAISVRSVGAPDYTLLTPRQKLTSTPYAIRSAEAGNALNATQADLAADASRLGGITANQFVVTTDPRMTDARDPLPGSNNYIRTGLSIQTT